MTIGKDNAQLLRVYVSSHPDDLFLKWAKGIDLDEDANNIMVRLLGWLSPKLTLPDDEIADILPRARGLSRWIWTKQQLTLESTRTARRSLRTAGINFLKSMELLPRQYSLAWDYGLPEIVVHPQQRLEALECLFAQGWQSANPRIPETRYSLIRGVHLMNPDGKSLFLRWYLFRVSWPSIGEESIWQNAADGLLHPNDQLLWTVLRASQHPAAKLLFFADTLSLMSSEFDWAAFYENAAVQKMGHCAGQFLDGLNKAVPGSIENEILVQLQKSKRSAWCNRGSDRLRSNLKATLLDKGPIAGINYLVSWHRQ